MQRFLPQFPAHHSQQITLCHGIPAHSTLRCNLNLTTHSRPPYNPNCNPQGSSVPDQCVGEFPSDGADGNHATWDIIQMTTLTAQAGVTTQAGCQSSCANEPTCQYFVFDNNAADKCQLHTGATTVVTTFGSTNTAVAFEVGCVDRA